MDDLFKPRFNLLRLLLHRSQRDLVKHWLLALHGTLEKDILEDDAYGITIPEFEPEAVVYDA
jgi:hypothetical protein